jgi:hypothetical protein
MNARMDGSGCEIELSRSNLAALVAKLDGNPMGSACTIMKQIDGHLFVVRAVEDVAHYFDRPRGVMHPDTEGAM